MSISCVIFFGIIKYMAVVELTDELKENDIGSAAGMPIHVEWTPDHEGILVEWADKAMCYRWLHSKAHQHYARHNMWFTIPVIIMSTITGTANFAQEKLPEKHRGLFGMAVGSVNIFAGILTTIAQFLKVSELNEAHRVASIAWDKFYRNTKVELAKSPLERMPVLQLLKHSKEEFDRLMETSPTISDEIIKLFKNTFSDGLSKIKGKLDESELSNRQKAYLQLKKPEICDTIESTGNSVYKPKDGAVGPTKNTMTAIGLARKAMEVKKKQDIVEAIIKKFNDTKGRAPTNQEIVDELEGLVALEFVEDFVANTTPLREENNIINGEENV